MFGIDLNVIAEILALDEKFDSVVGRLIDKHNQMENSDSYEDIALHALMASKLEKEAEQIFAEAKELLEVA